MAKSLPSRLPSSTYRLQLNHLFPFADADRALPYLQRLGISECYCSSFLTAKPGSMHGYDICDHSRINPELGGREAFDRFAETLRRLDLGLVLDFVPNHMSTDPSASLWWRNVLESGPSSPYAAFFDIDWDPVKPELKNRILLPVLGEQYGVALESGGLGVALEEASLHLRYYTLDLPLNPRHLGLVLNQNLNSLIAEMGAGDPHLQEFQSALFHLEHLPPYTETSPELVDSRQREKGIAIRRVAAVAAQSPAVRRHIDACIRAVNGDPGSSASFDLLHSLLELQPYRLSYWRTAVHDINYRRFFDINELAGIRMEEPEAFRQAHELVFDLIRHGAITGLRFDHIDGLYDPAGYLEAVYAAQSKDHAPWVVVEKILSEGETLPPAWRTHGSTGYEFLNDVTGLFVNPANSHAFHQLYARFTGESPNFGEVVYASKKLIIATSMASEANVLAHELNRIAGSHRRFRDFTLDSLQEALREIVACFPVYRSYVGHAGWRELDRQSIDRAVFGALIRNPVLEPSIFHFIRQMLLPERSPDVTEDEYQRRLRFSMKFQQYTGPVQAKGVEDTAFYRFGTLLALNEVGGDPKRFGRTPEEFHSANLQRQEKWPLTMLATATHDTKRGEDSRARICAISEMPKQWRTAISRWARANASARTLVNDEHAPDRGDEYLYYQALVGAWPPGLTGPPDDEFVARMRDFMIKAMKEKKMRTSWVHPSEEYDQAVSAFVTRSLAGRNAKTFLALFLSFQENAAAFGMVNSLAQLALKIGSPGVPDFYQGSELWDLNLIDPDNRRPVDFRLREQLLENMEPLFAPGCDAAARLEAVREMFEHWHDGRIKLFCTAAGLRLRRRLPEVFCGGDYIPLETKGDAAANVVAFARTAPGGRAVVAAPRLVAALSGSRAKTLTGPGAWGDTAIVLPDGWGEAPGRNVFTLEEVRAPERAGRREIMAADIFTAVPAGIVEYAGASNS